MVPYVAKRDFIDMIILKLLRMKDHLRLSGRPNVIIHNLMLAAGRELRRAGDFQKLEKTESPLEPSGRMQPC